jgi:hypothetical protein
MRNYLIFLSLGFLLTGKAHAFTVAAPELVPVIGRPIHHLLDTVLFDPFTISSGHEEITRQALLKTAKALNEVGRIHKFLQPRD